MKTSHKIYFKVANNGKPWKAWLNLDAPEEGNMPDGYNSQDVFSKLLLIRWDFSGFLAMRLDRNTKKIFTAYRV